MWSLSNSTARHARHVERVETWRDEPSGALIFNTMRWPSSNETRKYAAIRGQFRLAAHPRMRWPHLASTSVGIASVCRFRCTISHFRIHGPGIVVSNSSASCHSVTRRKTVARPVSKFICSSYMQPQISSRYFLSKKVNAKLTQVAVRLAYIDYSKTTLGLWCQNSFRPSLLYLFQFYFIFFKMTSQKTWVKFMQYRSLEYSSGRVTE